MEELEKADSEEILKEISDDPENISDKPQISIETQIDSDRVESVVEQVI